MNYPKIYSLSTVGILKHYVHDYLIHPLRTDFIGPNGVGKSIIADLLQLLFIYDTDVIKFGTDGIKQHERSIYTLPYKTGLAYCFLNVEVEKGKFVIIGITLSSQKGVRITPFVITKTAELTESLNKLVLSKDEILLAKDVISTGAIPDLKTLSIQLFNKNGVYLNSFKSKEDVKRYYQFLYDKEILSINLAVETNYNAFAKVIQSFSRAKALNLNSSSASKSLKEFLFEESEAELLDIYQQQQVSLEKILKEYNRLNTDIQQLEQKQALFIQLNKLDAIWQTNFRTYKEAELASAYNSLSDLRLAEKNLLELLAVNKNDLLTAKTKKEKLPGIKLRITAALKRADEDYDLHVDYEHLTGQVEKLDEEINELQVLNRVTAMPVWGEHIPLMDMSIRATSDVKELILFAEEKLQKYPTPSLLEQSWKEQNDRIRNLTAQLETEKTYTEKLISLLENNTADSLLGWALAQDIDLTSELRHTLLHFATLPVIKPEQPTDGSKYLSPFELVKNLVVLPDENRHGFWLTLGPLSEFIGVSADAELIKDSAAMGRSIDALLIKKKNELIHIKNKLFEIEKINRSEYYNPEIIQEDVDMFLVSYDNIKKLKEAVGCILYLDEKIKLLKSQRKIKSESLAAIKERVPVNIHMQEPEVFKKELKKLSQQQVARNTRFTTYEEKNNSTIEKLESEIKTQSSQLQELARSALIYQAAFDKLNKDFFDRFNENLLSFPSLIKELNDIEEMYKDAWNDYKVKYQGMVDQFIESKDGKSPEINTSIADKTYSFNVLEAVLLGGRIKTFDQIASALHDANRHRLSMADDIKSNMVKVFEATLKRYKKYKESVQDINAFFKGRMISDRFFFRINFTDNPTIKIELIEDIGTRIHNAAKQGELAFERPISEFIEEFFRKAARLTDRVSIDKLLNPKTYFDLSVSLTDEFDMEIPGSTGETYSAIALLGIARLSFVQAENRRGLRFIILEEIGSLDSSNFNTFPAIAKKFDYQILTMSPHPFRTSLADEWYAHHLIKGSFDQNINLYPSASYFKTKDQSERLEIYLNHQKNELDSTQGAE